MDQLNNLSSPTHYPSKNSYKQVVEMLLKRQKKKKDQAQSKEEQRRNDEELDDEKKMSKDKNFDTVSQLPTLCSPLKPQPGDIVMRHLLADGGTLTKIKRGVHDTMYHLRIPDGRQLFLEKKAASYALVITNDKGQAVHVLGCDNSHLL